MPDNDKPTMMDVTPDWKYEVRRPHVAYRLGVDVGTTFTAAAVANGSGPSMLGLGNRALQVPSVLFLTDDGEFLVGEAAERRGMTEPGRVVREFKRRIGDRVPVLVAGTPFSPETLTSTLLTWVVRAAAQQIGEPPHETIVTHPASWGGHRLERLVKVLSLADIGQSRTCTEPVAAAALYASRSRVQIGDRLAVYDLGGGTFDACVLQQTAAGFRLLGTPEGLHNCGGVDFDEALFKRVLKQLGNRVADLDGEDPSVIAGVARLRRDVVEAKEALSSDVTATVAVALPGINTTVRITRSEFETMIRPALQLTIDQFARTVQSAGMSPDQLKTIVLVGGSSRIPLVGEMLQREFGVPVAIDTHPKHDVALGATMVDADTGAASTTTLGPAVEVPAPAAPAAAADPTDLSGTSDTNELSAPLDEPRPRPSTGDAPVEPSRPNRRRRVIAGALTAAVSAGVVAGFVIAYQPGDGGVGAAPAGTQTRVASATSSVTGPTTTPGTSTSPPTVTKDPSLPRSAPLPPTQMLAAMRPDEDEPLHIYVGDSSVSAAGRRLTKGGDSDFNTVVSPDRQSVLFTREFRKPKGGQERTLKVMAVDGSQLRDLFRQMPAACSRSVFRPAWNPVDQTLLALPCESSRGVWSLTLIHTDGRQVRTIDLGNPPDVRWRVGDPTFSADGQRLLFWAGPETNGGAIYLVDLGPAKAPRRLTSSGSESRDGFPTWSPDQKTIFFHRRVKDGTASGNLDIYRMTADGSGKAVPLITGPGDEQGVSWSPNGKQFAYRSSTPSRAFPGSTVLRIWISNPQGKDRRLLWTKTDSEEQGSPSWSSR